MTHFEIETSVLGAKNGNHEELLKIFEQYKLFIIKTAKQFNIKNYDLYDILQIGNVALINLCLICEVKNICFITDSI